MKDSTDSSNFTGKRSSIKLFLIKFSTGFTSFGVLTLLPRLITSFAFGHSF